MYLTAASGMIIDTDNNYVEKAEGERDHISRIILAKEPMHVVFGEGDSEYNREFDVEKDDLIITFYRVEKGGHRVIVAKSSDWVHNIKLYNDAEQKRKEEWAAHKMDQEESAI